MIEFFNNISNWFMTNKDAILLYVSSGQFLVIVGMIAEMVKVIKSVKNNTKSTGDLNSSVQENRKLLSRTESVEKNTDEIAKIQAEIKEQYSKSWEKIQEILELQTNKINTVIEVQSIVYSTIKDEKVRNTVNNLLTNAKYAETATRAELQRQVEELKETVADKVQQINELVNEKVEKVVSTVNPDTNDLVEAAKEVTYIRG